VGELSYTEASHELDEIVAFFEQREVDVDLLVARLERATEIVDELDRRLRRTRAQVEELVPRLESAISLPTDADRPSDEPPATHPAEPPGAPGGDRIDAGDPVTGSGLPSDPHPGLF
jgi:exodeoxyribonuclease VII small subunit